MALPADQYDVIQLCLNGLSGVNRHLTMSKEAFSRVLKEKDEVRFSNLGQLKNSLLYDESSCTGPVCMDPQTLHFRPWAGQPDQRLGAVLCHVIPPSGNSSTSCSPRAAALRQVQKLSDLGLKVKSAFEVEFMIYEADGVSLLNAPGLEQYGRPDVQSGREDLLLNACLSLQQAGLPVETFMTEFAMGQFEITFKPEEGVASADSVVVMKEGVRDMLSKEGPVATYMPCPTTGHANGFHFNHSLWTEAGENAFLDPAHPTLMSDTARHWIAGLVHHVSALTALFCPTVNCYRRLQDELTPTTGTWGVENRSTYLRLKTEKMNVYVENRLPSSAVNPYLALAGTLAAGLDGIANKMECPPQVDGSAPPIPNTLDEALSYLEKDTALIQALGPEMVQAYMRLCKQGLEAQTNQTLDSFEKERNTYLRYI